MILATYQPYIDKKTEPEGAIKELAEHLGYYPIFCFPANTSQEIIIHSMLAAPNMPEKLILFETNDFVEIDVVKWNQKLAIECQNISNQNSIPILGCFTDKPSIYKEYVVKEIVNILEEVDIKQAFFDNYIPSNDKDSVSATIVVQLAEAAKNTAEHLCKQFQIPFDDELSWDNYSQTQKMLVKEIFQYTFLPLWYPAVRGVSFLDSTHFDFYKYIEEGCSKDVAMFYNPDEDLNYKSYGFYEKIYDNLRRYTSETHISNVRNLVNANQPRTSTKINPNSPCPCGSGKKYKKCCKNKRP